MSTSLDEDIFTILEHDHEIPCDIAGVDGWPETLGPAKWAMDIRCPSCQIGATILICDDCKEFVFEYRGPTHCTLCQHHELQLLHWIISINPI